VPTLSALDDGWRIVQDKARLGEVCERIGVPYPAVASVPDRAALEPALERVGLPAFVKSASSAVATPELIVFARGATFVRTREEAAEAFTRLEAAGLPVIVQHRIEHTEKLNAVVLRRDGRTELRYAHRVLREYPRTGGMGIALQSIDPHDGPGAEAVDVLERVCEEVGYRGVAQCEVYRSRDDGRLHLIDVNPRLWGSTWFGERQGLRVVERSLRAALDLPALPPPVARPGMRFHLVSSELRWLVRGSGRGERLRELARTTRPGDVFDWIDPSDPRPTARYLVDGVLAFPGSATDRRGR
jgi:5-(carboxyamino)imidazole ribonucleotide synthase